MLQRRVGEVGHRGRDDAVSLHARVAMGDPYRLVFAVAHLRARRRIGAAGRRWLLVTVGSIPAGLLLAAYNVAAYQDALTTGYGDMGHRFAVDNVALSVGNYVTWLQVLLTLARLGRPLALTARRDDARDGHRGVPSLSTMGTGLAAFKCWRSDEMSACTRRQRSG